MKKLWLALLIFLLALGACNIVDPSEQTSAPTTPISSRTETSEVTTVEWPTYMPEDISIAESGDLYLDEWNTAAKYRKIYYDTNITAWIVSRDDPKMAEILAIIEKDHHSTDRFAERDEMNLVTIIKWCDISKEDFIEAIEKQKLLRLDYNEWEVNFEDEFWEMPNPDIIYTFDNEVINAYYRRENPVVPDWSKTKTYESYEAYLEANGG